MATPSATKRASASGIRWLQRARVFGPVVVAVVTAGCSAAPRGLEGVRPAVESEFSAVRTTWMNPDLCVGPDDVELSSEVLRIDKRPVRIVDLAAALAALPARAWPYGRVVKLITTPLCSPENCDRIGPNAEQVRRILAALGVEAEMRPTG